MEAFTVSKAIVQSISATGGIASILQEPVDTYNDAPQSIKFILSTVEVMGFILSSLKSLLEDFFYFDSG
jgi:hypothetical protein